MNIAAELDKGTSLDEIGGWLNGLDHASRLQAVVALKAKEQALLYEAAEGKPCSLENDFIAHRGPLEEVIHWGKNSLPIFTRFQKRFCRPTTVQEPLVAYGYNHQPLAALTGPGYFVARDAQAENGIPRVVVDYFSVPDEKPASWPKILPNSARLSRFIYFQTRDWMWKVSDHVTIGRAKRLDSWMDNWFVLCRED